MSGDEGPISPNVDKGEGDHDPGRYLYFWWELEAKLIQPIVETQCRPYCPNLAANLSDAPERIGLPWPNTAASKSSPASLFRLAFPVAKSS